LDDQQHDHFCLHLVHGVLPAGWSLLQALLRPRNIMVGDDGSVSFVSKAGFSRIGAQEALRHSFLKPAAQHERSLKRSVSSTSSFSLDEGSITDDGSSSVTASSGSGGRRTAATSGSGSNGRSGSGGNGKAASSSSSSSSARSWWGGSAARRAAKEEEEAAAAAAAAAAEAEKAPPATMFTAAAGLWRGLQVGLWQHTAAAGCGLPCVAAADVAAGHAVALAAAIAENAGM
jgi:hypothetical protein